MRPKLAHKCKKPIELEVCDLDLEILMSHAKEKIKEIELDAFENQSDNYLQRQFANWAIEMGKVDLASNNNCYIVGHPLHKNKEQNVRVSADGKFLCDCRHESKDDCLHVIAVKFKTGHSKNVKDLIPKRSLLAETKTYTKEKRGGKNNQEFWI